MSTTASSIGIIGGADGPTAIFISGPPIRLVLICVAAVVAVCVIAAIVAKNSQK